MKKTQSGFTLIELMIVVAIIAILSAIAIPAFNQYIAEARMAKVTSHFDEAVRAVKSEMAKRVTISARGGTNVDLSTAAKWIDLVLDNENKSISAEKGKRGYASSEDSDDGVIGLTTATNDLVTIVRPDYNSMGSKSVTINASNI